MDRMTEVEEKDSDEKNNDIDDDTNKENNKEKDVQPDKKKKVGNYLLGKTIGEGTFAKLRQGFHVIAREKVGFRSN